MGWFSVIFALLHVQNSGDVRFFAGVFEQRSIDNNTHRDSGRGDFRNRKIPKNQNVEMAISTVSACRNNKIKNVGGKCNPMCGLVVFPVRIKLLSQAHQTRTNVCLKTSSNTPVLSRSKQEWPSSRTSASGGIESQKQTLRQNRITHKADYYGFPIFRFYI